MKKIFSVFLIGMIGIFVSGCSGNSHSAESNSIELSPKIKPTEIVLWHAMSGSNGEALDKVANDYNRTVGKEKGVKVKTVFQDTQIASKVKMASSSKDTKNAPDIIQVVGMDVPTISKLPQIVPASTFLSDKNSKITKDDYYEQLLRAFTYDKKIVGIPMSASTLMLYYNKDLLKQAGINKAPETLDELAIAAKTVGEKTNSNGLSAAITRYQLVNFITSQYPKSYFGNHEGGRSGFMTKLTIKEDGTLDKFLTKWQKVIDSKSYNYTEDNVNEEFASGMHSMALLSSSRLGAITSLVDNKFDFGVADLPKVNAKDSSGAAAGGASLVMYNRDDNNKLSAAWDFISYATSAETQASWTQNTGYIPVNKKTEQLDTMKNFYEKNPHFKVALDQMKASSPLSQEPFDLVNWEINDIVTDSMQKFAEGKSSKEKTIDEIVTKSNKALDEYHQAND